MEKTRFLPASPTATDDSRLTSDSTGAADLHNKWRTFLLEILIARLFCPRFFVQECKRLKMSLQADKIFLGDAEVEQYQQVELASAMYQALVCCVGSGRGTNFAAMPN